MQKVAGALQEFVQCADSYNNSPPQCMGRIGLDPASSPLRAPWGANNKENFCFSEMLDSSVVCVEL